MGSCSFLIAILPVSFSLFFPTLLILRFIFGFTFSLLSIQVQNLLLFVCEEREKEKGRKIDEDKIISRVEFGWAASLFTLIPLIRYVCFKKKLKITRN